MIKVDIKYFSEQDHKEAIKFKKWLREQLPIYFHEDSCNKINLIQWWTIEDIYNEINEV